jgi:tRNA(adenine34) deaminase
MAVVKWKNLEAPWRICFGLAWEAYCDGTRPIGSVIFNRQGRLISSARNRIGNTADVTGQISGGPLAHAEVNAILQIDFDRVDKYDCILFTTLEPCPLCVGAITMAGIKTVQYGARDPWAGATDLWEASDYMRWKAVEVFGPHPALEPMLHLLSIETHHRVNHVRSKELIERYAQDFPRQSAWGEEIHRSGLLARLCREGAAVEEVYQALLAYIGAGQ